MLDILYDFVVGAGKGLLFMAFICVMWLVCGLIGETRWWQAYTRAPWAPLTWFMAVFAILGGVFQVTRHW